MLHIVKPQEHKAAGVLDSVGHVNVLVYKEFYSSRGVLLRTARVGVYGSDAGAVKADSDHSYSSRNPHHFRTLPSINSSASPFLA